MVMSGITVMSRPAWLHISLLCWFFLILIFFLAKLLNKFFKIEKAEAQLDECLPQHRRNEVFSMPVIPGQKFKVIHRPSVRLPPVCCL